MANECLNSYTNFGSVSLPCQERTQFRIFIISTADYPYALNFIRNQYIFHPITTLNPSKYLNPIFYLSPQSYFSEFILELPLIWKSKKNILLNMPKILPESEYKKNSK